MYVIKSVTIFLQLVIISTVIVFSQKTLYTKNVKSKINIKSKKIIKNDIKYNWFWIFYEFESNNNLNSVTYRPFYLRNKKKHAFFEASLMPLFFSRIKTANKDQWEYFFGIGGSMDYTHKNNEKDYDFGFFPFVYYGASKSVKDRYLMVWPFGGTIKGKLAHEEISIYAFPGFLMFIFFPPSSLLSWTTLGYLGLSLIPVYAEYKDRDYRAWAVFWPLIQRGKSKKRDEFRILPFYAHNYKKDFYDNYSVLLLFNYRKIMFKKDVHKTFIALPVFGKKWTGSGRISATTILWPFFSWGYDKKHGDIELNLPWPLVQIKDTRNPEIRKRIFFPIYGEYKFRNNETFFLTPLYFSLKKKSGISNSEYYISFFIIWYFKRDYRDEHKYYGRSWRYFKIWPLFQYEFNDMGDFSFTLFSFFPFRDPDGYEKMYQPFWSLIEYKRLKNGEKRLGILLRTYYQRWGKNFFIMKIPFLVSYSDYKDRITELSFIFSMFGYSNNHEGRFVKLFWIPIRIGDGDFKEKPRHIAEEEFDLNKDYIAQHGNYYVKNDSQGDINFKYGFF